MTSLIDMTEREYFAQFALRTGMFVGLPTLGRTAAFLEGYHQAAVRYGKPGLTGLPEWLAANHGIEGPVVWWEQLHRIALPDRPADDTPLTPEQEKVVLKLLFELLDAFLAEREAAADTPVG
ncbi:hypothetical protein GCM10022243_56550 [Saccharothrix violaceirubra]|uniref:Uncharacterized protein n=1 Tax=Saccharothrix violaceirubra TaxID=413306 RepID=A0A7W7WWT0_9PSEU|nr:hypothetical protein [Saccharothrix violaceirubra]MBB4965913.1 hypothetical protein [Saccharothrix violaceirubra]